MFLSGETRCQTDTNRYKSIRNFFIAHLTNSIDLAMNDLCCYECSQDGACLNSFDCVFVHKEIRCANKTKIKTACNMQTKIYHYQVIKSYMHLRRIWKWSKNIAHFLNHYCLLEALFLWSSTDCYSLETNVSGF